jgi:peptidoglycan/xylan/chitin deacetylase (PgdA/CDA1 family)
VIAPADQRDVRQLPSGLPAAGWWSQARRQLALRALAPLRIGLGPRRREAFGILVYHRVAPETPELPKPTWNVPPDRFRAQLSGLIRRGYWAWPLRKVLDWHERRRPVPRNVFVVTFDDGYENVFRHAWPVLRELRVPATVFLATSYLDSERPFPCDDWSLAGSSDVPAADWRPLTTAQCRAMASDGLIELGTHTHTHADFRGRPEALAADLRESCTALRERFGLADATFAFPYGTKHLGFSGPELAAAAREAGVLCSLTTEDELVTPGSDPFDWGRFTAEDTDTAATLSSKLDGWYTAVRSLWRRLHGARVFVSNAGPVCQAGQEPST